MTLLPGLASEQGVAPTAMEQGGLVQVETG